ncbi:protocadherin-18-like [Clavelina lepadiformis]|uniref:protocadherin-18-like n=1 Tax=Clavelina lepadiformis TaxID=159417 RepID=UPI004041C3C8
MRPSLVEVTTAFACFVLVIKLCQSSKTLNLQIALDEETRQGTIVTDMMDLFGLSLEERQGRYFKLLEQKFKSPYSTSSTQHEYFAIDEETGAIRLRRKIDRDRVCETDKQCVLTLQAVMLPQEVFSLLNLDIVINDINDNGPKFAASRVVVNVSESVDVGEIFPLDQFQATDKDSGNNSRITYRLARNDHFEVTHFIDEAQRPHLQLVLLKRLDYETKPRRHLTLTAKDNGVPSRSTHMSIQIHVLDANDNYPVFDKPKYVLSLLENLEPGTNISRIHATDEDSGENGKVRYFLTPAGTAASELLTIDEESGQVSLKQKLDREKHDGLRVQIIARDNGTPPLSSQVWFTLQVDDVNDNAPTININFIIDIDENRTYLGEWEPFGTYVAFVRAHDADHGKNGQVTLSIRTQTFDEEGTPHDDTGHFVLASDGLITTGKPFDREDVNRYMLVIEACDNGVPTRCSSYDMTVEILDDNDHSPEFQQAIYSIELPEDAEIGTAVTQVTATDDDAKLSPALTKNKNNEIVPATNGIVRYSIKEDSHIFSINKQTGQITLVRPLDYEDRQTWEITVIAHDKGQPRSMKSSCLLQINVTDVNDNKPLFANPPLDNSLVYASILRDEPILTVETIDYDSDKFSKVRLEMVDIDDTDVDKVPSPSSSHSYFIFDPKSGDLRLNMSYEDLESLVGNHHVTIKASDCDDPELSSEMNIFIQVVDTLMLPSPPIRIEQERDADSSSNMFIIIIALACFVLLIIVVISVVAVKCKKDNKKVRTYNCRAAEDENGCTLTSNPGRSSKCDESAKSIDSNDVTSQVTANERVSNLSGSSGTSQAKSISDSSSAEKPTPRSSTSDTKLIPSKESSFYHVVPSLEKSRTPLTSFSSDPRMANVKMLDLIQHLPSHNDGDSGRGDSEPDNGSYNGLHDREYEKCQKYLHNNFPAHHSVRYDTGNPYSELGSFCTEECRHIGHSDACWMPPNASSNPAQTQNVRGYHGDSNRVLETIEESSGGIEYEPRVMREKVRRSVCLAILASESRHQYSDKRIHHSEDLSRQYNLWTDDYDSSPSVFGTPTSNSPAPPSEQCSSQVSSTNFQPAHSTIIHHENYVGMTAQARELLNSQSDCVSSLCNASVRDTQQTLNDINKLLVK